MNKLKILRMIIPTLKNVVLHHFSSQIQEIKRFLSLCKVTLIQSFSHLLEDSFHPHLLKGAIRRNKKAIGPILATILLLFVTVVVGSGVIVWFSEFQSGYEAKKEIQSGKSKLDILGIQTYNTTKSKIGIRNVGTSYHIISKVKVNSNECSLLSTNVVQDLDFVYLNCSVVVGNNYNVVVYSNNGIYSKTLTADGYLPTQIVPAIPAPLFVSVWNTSETYPGSSLNNQIKLPLESSGTYNFNITWGDGNNSTITSWNQSEVTHTYSTQGEYTLKINGTIVGFRFNNGGDARKILNIESWGPLRVGNNGGYFYGAINLKFNGTDTLNLTGTTNLTHMFHLALLFNGDISNWDTSQVIDMGSMFYNATSFNQNISMWCVTNVGSSHTDFDTGAGFQGQTAIQPQWGTCP